MIRIDCEGRMPIEDAIARWKSDLSRVAAEIGKGPFTVEWDDIYMVVRGPSESTLDIKVDGPFTIEELDAYMIKGLREEVNHEMA